MPLKMQRAARKRWMAELNERYDCLPPNASYLEVARAVSFFTNQQFEPSSKATAAAFLAMAAWYLDKPIMRFLE